jgi:hypothetical protein
MSIITKKLTEYASFAAAVATIGADNVNLVIDKDDTLEANLSIPSNIHCLFLHSITITTNGYTLAFGYPPDIGAFAVFDAAAGEVLGLVEASPEWFNGTDYGDRVNVALSAAPLVTMLSTSEEFATTIEMISGKTLRGMGRDRTLLVYTSTGTAIAMGTTSYGCMDMHLCDISLSTTSGKDGVMLIEADDSSIQRFRIYGFSRIHIGFQGEAPVAG